MECLPTATRPCRSSTIWATPHGAGWLATVAAVAPLTCARDLGFLARPSAAGLAVLSMTYGYLAALVQDNVIRLLAYSSIAHMGYALAGLAAGSHQGALVGLIALADNPVQSSCCREEIVYRFMLSAAVIP